MSYGEALAKRVTNDRRYWRWLVENSDLYPVVVLSLLILFVPVNAAANDQHPLEPLDTSSPRATLQSFLNGTDKIARTFLKYRENPTRANLNRGFQANERAERLLDLSEVPPATQGEVAADVVTLLWEVLSRIELPPNETIPDVAAYADQDDAKPVRWTIPHTEITIARVEKGARTGEFLFAPDTVAQAPEFYQRTRHLPYQREMLVKNPQQIQHEFAGWMIPPKWIDAAPGWLKTPVLEQSVWKWIALVLLFLLAFGATALVYRWRAWREPDRSLQTYLSHLALPVSILILMPLIQYLMTYQIFMTGPAATFVPQLLAIVSYLAAAWAVWLFALAVAEGIITSHIRQKSLDAHLLRLGARTLAIFVGVIILFEGGTQLGLPLYGLLAGLGVGGLAVALAAQNTLENFMGSLNLFVDRPVRVGELCRYGEEMGTVEEIGARSTRIRGLDRTVTIIPNADFSRMKIVNYTRRDQMFMRPTLRLRYETSNEQLRCILAKIRELLLADMRVSNDPLRVRFVAYGEYSINLEVFAYVLTPDPNEFFGIQEELFLRIKSIVEEAGAAFARAPRTVS